MTYVIVATVVVLGGAFIFLLSRWLKKAPRYHKVVGDDLTKFFRPLVDDNYQSSVLFIDVENDDKFLQFKIDRTRRASGIELGFPRAEWSEKYYDKMREYLMGRAIDYSEESIGDPPGDFITVDLQRDPDRAAQFTTAVLREVFGLSLDRRIVVHLSGW